MDIVDKIGISRYSDSEIITPTHIVKDMVDLLPAEIFNSETKFLDISCKSGRFLLEIYNRLMESLELSIRFPNKSDRRYHILSNQLYGIATSDLACSIVRKALYNDILKSGNIVYIANITKESIQMEFNGMNFDIVIGNPPYNNDRYLDFVTLGHSLSSKYTCMITPAKWQAKTDGKPKNKGVGKPDKNEEFRKNIVPYMSKVIFYKDSTDVFDIQEWGGISYFIIDKQIHSIKMIKNICNKNSALESDFEAHDETNLTLLNRNILSIIGKVGTLGDGFKQSLYVKNTDHGEATIADTLGFRRQTFTDEQERGESVPQGPIKGIDYVEVMQGEKVVGYKAVKDLLTTVGLTKYKCICSIMTGGCLTPDSNGRVLGITKFSINEPYQVPKGSFPVIRYFDTLEECKSFISYTESKLINFLYAIGACGSTLTKEFFRFVPDPKDWTLIYEDNPLPGYIPDNNGVYIDSDGKRHCALYSKYKLDKNDIKIIESIIKSRV